MDLRQLRYFVRVVTVGSITRAADALHIAQPALTQQMKNLEADLGMKLLERSVRGALPTAAGQRLYQHALELLKLADETRDLLLQDADVPSGRVSIAMPSSTARIVAIPLARKIREIYPGISLEIRDAPSESIGELVSESRVQLGIAVDQEPRPGLAKQKLLSEKLHLISSPEAPVVSGPDAIAMLARLPFVLPSQPNSIQSRVVQALGQAHLSCDIRLELTSTALVLAAVMAKLGVTVLPWSAVHQELKDKKVILTRIDHPLFVRELSLCWRDDGALTNAVEKVRTSILQIMQKLGTHHDWAS